MIMEYKTPTYWCQTQDQCSTCLTWDNIVIVSLFNTILKLTLGILLNQIPSEDETRFQ